jgi:RNA polymerase I-specific transcription initiation factor RRN3
MMLLLFQHIEERISKDPESASAIFQMILPVFENAILTTYRSKYVQFILLYVCGFSDTEELYREFAGKLIEQVVDPYRATATRQSAACYLASFVSRASYVCSETACEAVAALLRWAETYVQVVQRNGTESSDLRSPCELHSLFFTICQAAFYIMCFRGAETVSYHREALEYFSTPKEDLDPIEECPYPGLDHIDIGTSRWEHLCGHRLQPLRYCLESVREEFINVAEVFELVQPELLARLETEAQKQSTGSKPARPRGKPINTPATLAIQRRKGGVGGLGRGSNPLDSFFPFDPYLLRRSHEYIDPLYQHWEGSIEKQDVDDDREDEIAPQEEMGSNMDASETEEEVDDDDEEDDSSSVEPEQEHMTASVGSSSFLQNMSYNSETTSLSSSIQHGVSPSPAEYRQAQQEAWSNALKRPRAPSIAENGSW